MRISDIQEHNITNEELDYLSHWFDGLSDFCEMCDGTWGIEWDGPYGRHWDRFETEALAQIALDEHSDRQLGFLPHIREEIARNKAEAVAANIAKGKKIAARKRLVKEAGTIGGNCPELAELLSKMQKQSKVA